MELLIFISLFFVILVLIRIALAFHTSPLQTPFINFTIGTLLVGLSRFFLFLSDKGIYHLEVVDMHLWWHLIFYMGMFCFILGCIRLREIAQNTRTQTKLYEVIVVLCLLLSITIFFIAQPLEPLLSPLLVGSLFDKLGVHHLIAVILAIIVGVYIYFIRKNWGSMLAVGVYPLILFLFHMGFQHLWELLTESLKVIDVSQALGEQVEQFIVLPGVLFFIFGVMRIARNLPAK